MKSYKSLLNEAMNNSSMRKITDEESRALKRCILSIFDDVSKICEENGLMLQVGGGTCLGAVRHQGYIPWDDDMDFNMPRSDYDKLTALLESGALGKNYEFVYPNSPQESPTTWLQIYRKDTMLIHSDGIRKKYPNGCYIDIFPIEGVPSNKTIRKWKGYVANSLRLIANTVDEAWEPLSVESKQFYASNPKLKRMIYCRRMFGRIFSFFSHKKWVDWYDSFVRDKDMTGYVSIPAGRNLYFMESHPAEVFFPPKEGVFEGRKVWLPANEDAYLKALYGSNYMEIPPVGKRESHFIRDLKLPDSINNNN